MTEREELLAKAAQDFIDKVDRGAARSEQSYAAFKAALAATPAVGGEPVAWIVEFQNKQESLEWSTGGGSAIFYGSERDDYQAHVAKLRSIDFVETVTMTPLYATQPASPLRGREDLAPSPCSDLSIGELIEWLDNPQWTNGYLNSDAANHMSAAAELIERLVSSAPPEQPASPLRGRETIANAICEYCRSLTPAAVQNSHGVERIYYAGLSVYGLTDAILSASPPEQPAADPVTGRFGEPVWPNNDEANDLDKGDDA